MNNSWFYILRGQRLGPIAEDDLIAMHQSGTIDDDTLVWTPNAGQGQMGWRPYSEAGLNAVATSEGPVGPPPAPLSQISNKYVWLIVFAPIFLAAVELIEFWSPHTYSGVAPSFGKAGRASGSGLLW